MQRDLAPSRMEVCDFTRTPEVLVWVNDSDILHAHSSQLPFPACLSQCRQCMSGASSNKGLPLQANNVPDVRSEMVSSITHFDHMAHLEHQISG